MSRCTILAGFKADISFFYRCPFVKETTPIKIEDGLNINIYATMVNQTFAEQWFSIYERMVPSPYKKER